jgi:tRNA dimethylallyltransferase
LRLVAIVGPTASGKTALACALAEALGAEIVSADSQQCYRGLDAGTAKPTAAERARAPHHLLDVADPEEQLDAAAFVRLAEAAMADIAARGKRVIVAGGTGLWIRALLRGLLQAPGASPELRGELRRQPLSDLYAKLQEVDQASARRILPGDRVRIERALEVHALSGRPLSELQREHGFATARHDALTFFLDPPRELLRDRIAQRTGQLFESGALRRETEWLLSRGASKALKIIGYGEMAEALRTGGGSEAFAAAEERVNARTRQYARRQRTWFAKDAGAPLAWPFDAKRLCEAAERWYEDAAEEEQALPATGGPQGAEHK